MITDHVAVTIAGNTAGTAESEVGYILAEIYFILQQGQGEKEVTTAAEGEGGFMPINWA
jgi:hypothetical protein